MNSKLLSKLNLFPNKLLALKAILLSGFLTVLIKFFGLIKEAVLANYFGVSNFLDIYILSMLTLLFFVNPIAGTIGTLLTQKFIEVKFRSKNIGAGLYRESCKYTAILIISVVFAQLFIIQLSQHKNFFNYPIFELGSTELFVLAPIAFFSSIAIINGAVLTAKKKFAVFSIIPALVPLSIIFCVTFDVAGNLFVSLLIGTVGGFGLEMIFGTIALLPSWKQFSKSVSADFELKLKEIKAGFPPLFAASLIMGGCVVVDQLMAAMAGEGAVSVVSFGSRLTLGLLSVVGTIWIILFPFFSEMVVKDQHQRLKRFFIYSLALGTLALVPFCSVLVMCSEDIIRILFERGAFNSEDTLLVSKLQIFYLMHIPFYMICMLSMRVANSYQRQKIILFINTITLITNIFLNVIFMKYFGVVGIAAATFLSYSIMACVWIFVVMLIFNKQRAPIFSTNKLNPLDFLKNCKAILLFVWKQIFKNPFFLLIYFSKGKMFIVKLSQFTKSRSLAFLLNLVESFWANIDAKSLGSTPKVLFVDLGANLGQGFRWFKKYYRGVNITFELFEPNPFCCEKLHKLPEISSGDVKLINAAVSDFSGVAPLFGISSNKRERFSVGGTLIEGHSSAFVESFGNNSVEVKVVDFSEYLRQKKNIFEKIVVKMDIEGAEIQLLESLIETGMINAIDILYVEFHSRFQGAHAKKTKEREDEIINKLSMIPQFKLRKWH